MQGAKITKLSEIPLKGGGQWPPPSPWVWQDSWWDAQGIARSIVLSFRFDDTNTGTGTLAFQGCDYDLDPACPWQYLIVVRSDGTRITHQIPRTARTGTITMAQLAAVGLNKFTDIGSVTVGVSPN
jgi:hypothetical protein